jgi:hypothetical protein
MIAGDGISATYASGANATTPVGVYSAGANAIAPTLIDPGSKLGNYTGTQNLGALTVTQVTTGLTWATPAAIAYGTPLSGAQLNATSGGVAGTFVYSSAAGAVLSAGAHPLNVTFTPTDGVDYSTATASVTLTVNPAVLTVTPAPSSKVYGTANPVFTGSITGMIPGDGISATYSSAATATTVVGVYASGPNAIVATLSDPQSKLGNHPGDDGTHLGHSRLNLVRNRPQLHATRCDERWGRRNVRLHASSRDRPLCGFPHPLCCLHAD